MQSAVVRQMIRSGEGHVDWQLIPWPRAIPPPMNATQQTDPVAQSATVEQVCGKFSVKLGPTCSRLPQLAPPTASHEAMVRLYTNPPSEASVPKIASQHSPTPPAWHWTDVAGHWM